MKKLYICFFIFFFSLLTSCTEEVKKETFTFYAMDTIISITFYNVDQGQELSKEVEKIYLQYESVADDFQEGISIQNVYDLNEKREIEGTAELKELLEFAIQMKEETNGYYNPFIGRLSHLWKDALAENKVVEDSVIVEELEIMNQTFLEFTDTHIKLLGEGNVDLGGVAKGYATSLAKEYLDSVNCHSYLLNAGSSNLVLGNKNGKNFVVGLSKALGSGYFHTLSLQNKCISTSSIKEQNVKIGNVYYSHLLNPKTGYPAMYYESLSIIGEDSKVLDAYSTAGFAMELEELKQFLETKQFDFIVSNENKLLYKSVGVDQYA